MNKVCRECKEEKHVSEFYKSIVNGNLYYKPDCIECMKKIKYEIKSCIKCNKIKYNIDFLKNDNLCKECRYEDM